MSPEEVPALAEPRILAWRLSEDQQVKPVSWQECVENPGPCSWIHVEKADRASTAAYLSHEFGFPEGAARDASHGFVRTGIDHRGGSYGFVLPFLEEHPVGEFKNVGFLVRKGLVVTVAEGIPDRLAQVKEDWMDDPDDIGPDISKLIHSMLDANIDGFFPYIDNLQDEIENLEDTIFESNQPEPERALALKRNLLEARRELAPTRDVLSALLRHGSPCVPPESAPDYQDLIQHIMRLIDGIDLGRDILSSIMDAQLSVVSNRLNEVMRTLTVISTLMMACSLIAGIYGMNFTHMPELKWYFGYPFALLMMAAVCGLILWVFRKRGWY